MIAAHSTKQFQENSFAFNIKKKKNEISAQNESKPHSGKKITARIRAKNREGRKRITTMHKHSISLADPSHVGLSRKKGPE